MSLKREDVDHVAKLARLSLSEEQKKSLEKDLGSILSFIDHLKKLDVSQVPPTTHAVGQVNQWREDEVRGCENSQDILAGAPDRDGDYFRVKKIISS